MKNLKVTFLIGAITAVLAHKGHDIGNPHIEEPCEHSHDYMRCVRYFLHNYLACRVIEHPPKGSLYYKGPVTLYTPSVNTTMNLFDVRFENLQDTHIEDFYINKDSGNVVITLYLPNLGWASRNGQFIINQKGKEPKMVNETLMGTANDVLITGIVSSSLNIKASAYTYKGTASFTVESRVSSSKDPVIAAMYNAMIQKFEEVYHEMWLLGAYHIFLAYIENFVCDFGIELPVSYPVL